MKKKLFGLVTLFTLILGTLTGCGNKQIIDTTYSYGYGIVRLANDVIIEGEVESWTDFEDGDQVQVKINGKTYLVHMTNASLMSE